jgi:VWFA-related protein
MERLMVRRAIWLCLFSVSAAAGSGVCQTASPKAEVKPAAKQTTAAAAAASPEATLKATAQLVLVDVVVRNSSHAAVHGLTAADFSLTEGGVPQTIKHFEEHTALTQADATKFPSAKKLPPGIFTNYTPAPANGAVNLILLDTLNTPLKDQAYVRQQLLAYLKATPPGTRIAIFGLTTRLIVLQGFTSDPDALRRVMEKGVGKGSPLLDDQVGGGGIQNSEADNLEDMADSGAPIPADLVANLREFDAVQQSFQSQLRAKYTLDAMNQIARYLSNIPGRKNLIWFSGSFPVNILPDTTGTLPDPFAAMASSEDEFRDTVNLLARSQVAVYPIDARGLMTSPMFDVTTTRNYTGSRGPARMAQDQQKFFSDTAEEQGTMRAMADATGGHAFVNNNGLTAAVATAIEEGSNFYTLTYTPTNSQRDGKLRKINVQVSRPGLTLTYRKGYYADPPNGKSVADAALAAASAPTPGDSLHFAMTRGVPVPSEVILEVGVVSMTPQGQTEDKVAPGNQVSAKTKGPYRRYAVNYLIDPGGLVFIRDPEGTVHGDFDLLIFVFTAEGELVNSHVSPVRIAMKLDDLRKAVAQGLIYHQEVSAPAKGEYFLRIGVHELHADHYGAVEVATSAVKNARPVTHNSAAQPAVAR